MLFFNQNTLFTNFFNNNKDQVKRENDLILFNKEMQDIYKLEWINRQAAVRAYIELLYKDLHIDKSCYYNLIYKLALCLQMQERYGTASYYFQSVSYYTDHENSTKFREFKETLKRKTERQFNDVKNPLDVIVVCDRDDDLIKILSRYPFISFVFVPNLFQHTGFLNQPALERYGTVLISLDFYKRTELVVDGYNKLKATCAHVTPFVCGSFKTVKMFDLIKHHIENFMITSQLDHPASVIAMMLEIESERTGESKAVRA